MHKIAVIGVAFALGAGGAMAQGAGVMITPRQDQGVKIKPRQDYAYPANPQYQYPYPYDEAHRRKCHPGYVWHQGACRPARPLALPL
jgi:hypothetical protein